MCYPVFYGDKITIRGDGRMVTMIPPCCGDEGKSNAERKIFERLKELNLENGYVLHKVSFTVIFWAVPTTGKSARRINAAKFLIICQLSFGKISKQLLNQVFGFQYKKASRAG